MARKQIKIWHVTAAWRQRGRRLQKDFVVTARDQDEAREIATSRLPDAIAQQENKLMVRDLGMPQDHRTYFSSSVIPRSLSTTGTLSLIDETAFLFTKYWGMELGKLISDPEIENIETDPDVRKLNDEQTMMRLVISWAHEYHNREYDKPSVESPAVFFDRKIGTYMNGQISVAALLPDATSSDIEVEDISGDIETPGESANAHRIEYDRYGHEIIDVIMNDDEPETSEIPKNEEQTPDNEITDKGAAEQRSESASDIAGDANIRNEISMNTNADKPSGNVPLNMQPETTPEAPSAPSDTKDDESTVQTAETVTEPLSASQTHISQRRLPTLPKEKPPEPPPETKKTGSAESNAKPIDGIMDQIKTAAGNLKLINRKLFGTPVSAQKQPDMKSAGPSAAASVQKEPPIITVAEPIKRHYSEPEIAVEKQEPAIESANTDQPHRDANGFVRQPDINDEFEEELPPDDDQMPDGEGDVIDPQYDEQDDDLPEPDDDIFDPENETASSIPYDSVPSNEPGQHPPIPEMTEETMMRALADLKPIILENMLPSLQYQVRSKTQTRIISAADALHKLYKKPEGLDDAAYVGVILQLISNCLPINGKSPVKYVYSICSAMMDGDDIIG